MVTTPPHHTQPLPLSQLLSQKPLQAVPTSVPSLDLSLHGGLVPAQLYEFYGLNNTGKSTVAAQLCINALKQNKQVLWITMMQTLPTNTLLQLDPQIDLNPSTSRVTHYRITNTAALFMLLLQIPPAYGLIIIEDFALAVNRSMGQLGDMITKPKISPDTRRNKTILEFMKCLNFYCGKSKASCVFFNPVDTLSMSFVKVEQHNAPPIPLSSTPSRISSSQSFLQHDHHHHQQAQQRPKRINQQILISALGDNSQWNSYFRARIMLYKDWSVGNMKTATFANIKHSRTMTRILQSKGIQPKVVKFYSTKDGVKDANQVDEMINRDIGNSSRHEFTLDEKDLESDYEDDPNADDDDVAAAANTVDEEVIQDPLADDNTHDHIPSSPLHGDIQNAREMLSSQLEALHTISTGEPPLEVLERDMLHDLDVDTEDDDDDPESTIPEERTTTVEVSDTTALSLVGPLDSSVDEATDEQDANAQKEPGVEQQSEEIPYQENNNEETDEHRTPPEADEDLRIASMMSDNTSIEEIQEIEDELEELYPTQPEAISVIKLTQLQSFKSTTDQSFKRSKTSPDAYTNKRMKVITAFEESQGNEDDSSVIPSTFPFF